MAFGCWPSSGFVRLGFEVKVARGDFLRELEDHAKRAALEQHCHQVWFVVPAGVCEPREIPEPWGLLQVAGDGLRARVKAQHRAVGPVAEPLAVGAIRRLVEAQQAEARRHHRFDGVELTQDDLDRRVDELTASARARLARDQAAAAERMQKVDEARQAFEAEAGVWWDVWAQVRTAAEGYRLAPQHAKIPPTRAQILEAVHRIRERGRDSLAASLRAARDRCDAALLALETEAGEEPATPDAA